MSPRQAQILTAIVELYAKSAEPVGSAALSEQFDYSAATIRAEMAALERAGYIMQPHISAGRVPTDKGYRTYVNGLHVEQDESRVSRAAYAIERQIQGSGEAEQAVKNAAQSLAIATKNLGIATWMDHIHRFGMSNLFGHPEFYGGQQALEVARLLDYLPEYLHEIFPDSNRVSVLIGNENPIGKAAGASSIIGRVHTPYGQSFIGVIGPTRQDYHHVVGLVDYVSRKLEEALT
jgi:heat-inducible transcriptional repressor